MAKAERRFEVAFEEGGAFTPPIVNILVDRQTGVNYLLVMTGNGAGLTPLLDAEGRPVVTPSGKQVE